MNSSHSATLARIWVLLAEKTGDNAQLLHVAKALDLPVAVKQLVLQPQFGKVKTSIVPSLYPFDPEKSAPLMPPWPDLCLTAGRQPSMAALWIKQQSGGRTKLALLNRPKGSADEFDLIITPGVYKPIRHKHLLRIAFPVGSAELTQLASNEQEFRARFSDLERPIHALLLGGMGGGDRQAATFAVHILKQMKAGHAAQGSVFVTTSRRTPIHVAEALQQVLDPRDCLFRWSPDNAYNPYTGLLAAGDTFTVTADSLSMMTEVARLAKPLVIAEARGLEDGFKGLMRRLGLGTVKEMRWAVDYLCANRHAVRLGEMPIFPSAPLPDETPLVVERLHALIAQ